MSNAATAQYGSRSDAAANDAPAGWLIILVVLAASIPFLPVLWNGFVNWDDLATIVDNPHIRGVTWPHLRWMFTGFHLGPYQPLSWLSLAIDYSIWGLNPFGFHLTSLVLHVASAVSFYCLSRRLIAVAQPVESAGVRLSSGAAALAAIFFSAHPLRVESVAWATERRDVLCGLLVLWSLQAYLRATAERPQGRTAIGWLTLSWLLFVASLLSKATSVALPVVLVLLDVYPLARLSVTPRSWFTERSRLVWLEKIPFAIASLLAGIAAIHGQRVAGAMNTLSSFGPVDRLVISLYGCAFYVFKTLFPFSLSPLYELPRPGGLYALKYLGAGAFTVAATLTLWLNRRCLKPQLVAWLSYAVLLGPVSGLAQSGPQIAADRYSYLPCMGFAVLVGCAAMRLCRRRYADLQRGFSAIVVVLLFLALFLGSLTWRQSRVWHDSETLWNHAIALNPSASMPYAKLAQVMLDSDRTEHAVGNLLKAIRLRPDNAEAHSILGVALVRQGNYPLAMEHYTLAVRLRPASPESYYNIGKLLSDEELLDELGFATREAQWLASVEWYERALHIRPDNVDTLNNLGIVYKRLGQLEQAIDYYEQAISIDPNSWNTHSNLAMALAEKGEVGLAIERYRWVLSRRPDNVESSNNLAELLRNRGDCAEAVEVLRTALRFAPENTFLLRHLIWTLATAFDARCRDGQEAVNLAERLVRIAGSERVDVLDAVAAAYAEAGRFDDAAALASRAAEIARGRELVDLAANMQQRVELYRSGRPFRAIPRDALSGEEQR